MWLQFDFEPRTSEKSDQAPSSPIKTLDPNQKRFNRWHICDYPLLYFWSKRNFFPTGKKKINGRMLHYWICNLFPYSNVFPVPWRKEQNKKSHSHVSWHPILTSALCGQYWPLPLPSFPPIPLQQATLSETASMVSPWTNCFRNCDSPSLNRTILNTFCFV